MWKRLCVNYQLQVFLSGFNETLIFYTEFLQKLKYRISSKSVQWEPDERIDRQTDKAKLIVAFRNFWNAPKNRTVR